MIDLLQAQRHVEAHRFYREAGAISKSSPSERAWAVLEAMLKPLLDDGKSLGAALRFIARSPEGQAALAAFLDARDETPEPLPAALYPKQKDEKVMGKTKQPTSPEAIVRWAHTKAESISKIRGISESQARAQVWREHPEMVRAYREAGRKRSQAIAKMPGPTLSEQIEEALTKRAMHIQATDRLGDSLAAIRADLRRTEIGQMATRMQRARGGEPADYVAKAILDLKERIALDAIRRWVEQ